MPGGPNFRPGPRPTLKLGQTSEVATLTRAQITPKLEDDFLSIFEKIKNRQVLDIARKICDFALILPN